MTEEKTIEKILQRLDRLERTVFGNDSQKVRLSSDKIEKFKGITGGVRLLISQNFFKNKKRGFTEIKEALIKENYYSSAQAVQGALDNLSTSNEPLRKFKIGGINYYAERK